MAITSDADVVTARQRARGAGRRRSGFPSTDLTLLATAISEVARNITTYARRGRGARCASCATRGRRRASRWWRSDDGPGIADVELAMQDGYTTGERPRSRAARRAPARGRVRARTRRRAGHDGAARQVGACRDADDAGRRSSSAAWRERPIAGRGALGRPRGARGLPPAARWSAAIDGLGHGDEAADAAALPPRCVRAHADDEPAALLEALPRGLRGRRAAW